MSTLINRGSSAQWTAEDLRARERRREIRAGIRATHGAIGWACPACGTHQVTEYDLSTWQHRGHVDVACRQGDRARDLIRGQLKSRVSLDEAHNPTAPQWAEWTRARWEYESTVATYQRRLDGYYGPLSGLQRPTAPPPRWEHPTPPHATVDALAGAFPVRLLEPSSMPSPLYATLHLPSGLLTVVIKTDWITEDGQRLAELIISPPERDDLRAEVALLLPPEERDEFEAERWTFDVQRPYGLESWCWIPRLSRAPSAAPPSPTTEAPTAPIEALSDDEEEDSMITDWMASEALLEAEEAEEMEEMEDE